MSKFTKVIGILSIAAFAGVSAANAAKNPATAALITPSPDVTVNALPKVVTVMFPGMLDTPFEDDQTSVTVTLAGPEGISENIRVGENNLGSFENDNFGFQINVNGTYTTPGEYVFTIPGGMFYEWDWDFENSYQIKYTVVAGTGGDPVDPSAGPKLPDGVGVYPEPNEVASDPTSFAGVVDIVFRDYVISGEVSGDLVTVTGPNNYTKKFAVTKATRDVTDPDTGSTETYPDNRRLQFTLKANDFPASGDYIFTANFTGLETVPANAGQKFSWVYKVIVNGQEPVTPPVSTSNIEYTVEPDNTGLVSEIPATITVMFTNVLAVMNGQDSAWDLQVKMVSEANDVDETFDTDLVDMGKGLKFDVPAGFTDPGEYTFTVLFGDRYIYYDDNLEKHDIEGDIVFTYTVGGFNSRIEPGAGKVEKLTEITVTFPTAEKAEVVENAEITFKSAKGADVPFTVSANGNVIKLTLTPEVTEDGIYTLIIPANSIKVDGYDYEKAIRLEYTINSKSNGVASIFVDGEDADVYAVDGRIVVRNANAETLNGLAKGIYVVNGKKVLVK